MDTGNKSPEYEEVSKRSYKQVLKLQQAVDI